MLESLVSHGGHWSDGPFLGEKVQHKTLEKATGKVTDWPALAPPCLQTKGKEGNPVRIGRTATVVKACVRHVIEIVLAIITIILHGKTGAV